MFESSRPLPGTGASLEAPGRTRLAVAGEFAGAAFVLALAGAAIWLLATTLAAGQAGEEPSGSAATASTTTGGTPDRSWSHEAAEVAPRIFIVVATEERAAEIRRDLASEANVRALLSELPRDAEVIAAASELEAEALAATINDQANMHGVAPMAAIVAR